METAKHTLKILHVSSKVPWLPAIRSRMPSLILIYFWRRPIDSAWQSKIALSLETASGTCWRLAVPGRLALGCSLVAMEKIELIRAGAYRVYEDPAIC